MKTKTKNEIVIDGVRHVLVPDSDEGCSSCSLRERMFLILVKMPIFCALYNEGTCFSLLKLKREKYILRRTLMIRKREYEKSFFS